MARKAAALKASLPKWPAMTVMGEAVSRDQAAEILIRTNPWYQTCNDHEWENLVWKAIGVKVSDSAFPSPDTDSLREAEQRLRSIPLSYLHNHRVMSSWIGGPHGWCHWHGDIHTVNYNIGKWPQPEEVLGDWQRIAEAFPFLNLRCQLWSGETSEEAITPVVEYIVRQGRVRAATPKKPLLYPSCELEWGSPFRLGRERGCDIEVLQRAIQLTLDAEPRSVWDRLRSDAELL